MNPITAQNLQPTPGDSVSLWVAGPGGPFRSVGAGGLLIGADPSCDLVLPISGVSPHHLRIAPTPYGWVLTDAGSVHGTWVDGRRLVGPVRVTGPLEVTVGHAHSYAAVRLLPRPAEGSRRPAARRTLFAVLAALIALAVTTQTLGGTESAAGQGSQRRTTTASTPTVPSLDRIPAGLPSVEAGAVVPLGGHYIGDGSELGLEDLLEVSLQDVEAYWTPVLLGAGLPAPAVEHQWIRRGETAESACGEDYDDVEASYCPLGDRIAVGLRLARAVWAGVLWDQAPDAAGPRDLLVALILAHEYGHDVQDELGLVDGSGGLQAGSAHALEQHADCLAGVWANGAVRAGVVREVDVFVAAEGYAGVGDDDPDSPHGTPAERHEALLTGYRQGTLHACTPYLELA